MSCPVRYKNICPECFTLFCTAHYTWRIMCENSSKIIDELGGTVATARLCNVTKGAVSQWRINGIPPAREMYLRLLRPEVFGLSVEKRAA